MKIRLLIGSLFLISFLNMKAQEKFSVNMNLKTEPTDKIDFNEASIGIFFNAAINSKNEIKNTIEYSNLKVNYEQGSFKAFENLDQFVQIKNKFEIAHTFSSPKLNLALTPTANFQRNLEASDITLLGSFEISQQIGAKANLNIGVSRTAIFGYPKFIPTLSFQYKVNDKSALLIGFPDSKISYSNNVRNAFSLTNSFNGNFYNLDNSLNQVNNAAKVSVSQMTSALEYERNVDKNWFINFKAGYDFNKTYNLIDDNNHKVYDFNTGNGYILGIGIKYKQ
ncbi:hypothetical protein IRZ71_19275 [Flavobacterium sp. ANB]|uniref:DUF6268 family outer membrane beta-barrel protein n=1 Tax=unclassified Flavobacterium TaxID=196869 RepID=UPI0012BA037E|nr:MULTISPECIES: DUF6268 family outer membrane beta-barrel protein [unclassified Flavobacterium]MBF4518504.1 hypothetical protein [Flavobacterium sp. ANB]MTD67990.1 hypothetical protein [Flavobacterium sp. LC2016-13]